MVEGKAPLCETDSEDGDVLLEVPPASVEQMGEETPPTPQELQQEQALFETDDAVFAGSGSVFTVQPKGVDRRKIAIGVCVLLLVVLIVLLIVFVPDWDDDNNDTNAPDTDTLKQTSSPDATPTPGGTPTTPPTQTASTSTPLPDICGAPDVQVGRYSKKTARTVVLPNGIPVVIFSDPDAALASAAFDVGVGSFDDPEEFYGLAHFVEHMVFKGSARYPGESQFGEIVQRFSGSSNAFTDSTQTSFFFECAAAGLAEVLGVFGGFIDQPLFPESGVLREVAAVDSEYKAYLPRSVWRTFALQKETAENKPMKGFSVGSVGTLNKTGVRDALVALHARSYTTDNIAIAVTAPLPLDALQDAVLAAFGAIPRSTATRPQWVADPASMPLPYPTPGRIVTARPYSPEERRLKIVWQVPFDTQGAPPSPGPGAVLAFLIGQEGAGGLPAVLRDAGLATNVVSEFYDRQNWVSLPAVTIELTEAGLQRIDDIVATVYAYLRTVRETGVVGLEQWYARVQRAAVVGWDLLPESQGMNAASGYAFRLRKLQESTQCLNHVTNPPSLWAFNETLALAELDEMKEENMWLYLFSEGAYTARKAAQPDAAQTEPWFQVAYVSEVVSDARRASWAPALSPLAAVLRPPPADALFSVSVPDAASDTDAPAADDVLALPAPTALPTTSGGHIDAYYRGSVFTRPVGVLRVRLLRAVPAVVVQNIRNVDDEVAAALASRGVNNALRDVRAQAAEVAMSFAVSFDLDFLEVALSGVVAQFPALLSHILNALSTPFNGSTTNFATAKQDFSNGLLSWRTESWLVQQALSILDSEVTPDNTNAALTSALTTASQATAEAVANEYKGSCQLLLASNTKQTPRDAAYSAIAAQLRSAGFCSTPSAAHNPLTRVLRTKNWNVIRRVAPNSQETAGAATDAFQLGVNTPEVEARSRVLQTLMGEAFFTQLRSVEALGYVAQVVRRVVSGVVTMYTIVQGSVRDAGYMGARIQNFLFVFEKTLEAMDGAAFATVVQSMVAEQMAPPADKGKESEVVWSELTSGTRMWDRRAQVLAALRGVTQATLLEWYRENFLRTESRRITSVLVWPFCSSWIMIL